MINRVALDWAQQEHRRLIILLVDEGVVVERSWFG